MVQLGMAEPYPTLPAATHTGWTSLGQELKPYESAASDVTAASSSGWTFMQARNFEFDFKYLSPVL
jgi:hypothetical protein